MNESWKLFAWWKVSMIVDMPLNRPSFEEVCVVSCTYVFGGFRDMAIFHAN